MIGKVLIVGAGELGGLVLEIMARMPNICSIVVGDINEEWGFRKANSAILGASYLDLYPDISFAKMNLLNTERTAEQIDEIKPDLIFNATTLQSWWVITLLPKDIHKKLYVGIGPWVPMHLALTYQLMQAVKSSGINPIVVNSSFPDAVNPSLRAKGLSPVAGIGNIDLAIPALKKAVSEKLKVPMRSVIAYFVGHHYHAYWMCRFGTGYDAPYYLKLVVGSHDVTKQFEEKELWSTVPEHARRPDGAAGQYVVASSAVRMILAFLNDSGEISHSPGPLGLVGGYPVQIKRSAVEIMLPDNLTLKEAVKINEEAQRYDGIEQIAEDGRVFFTERAVQTMQEMLGYDCSMGVSPEESLEKAEELGRRFRQFAEKHGVRMNR